jgi:voltage-gated sodium channel
MMEDGQNISIAEQNRLKSRRRSLEIEAARLEEYEGSRAKPESYSGVLRWYLILSNRMYGVAKSAWFDNFIMAVILTASIMISIETYDGMEGNLALLVINLIILAIFTVEVVVKLIAQSLKPWLYFMGPQRMWNTFDFSIVVMSYTLEGNSIAALRLLRLCRLVKLVNKIPKLRTLIEGLFAGLSQIGYIALLMCLIFYIFAILGILLFRENDPAHWEHLGMAGVTLFRCATLEVWTRISF